MNQTGLSRLLVAENDRLVGILTLKDLLAFLPQGGVGAISFEFRV